MKSAFKDSVFGTVDEFYNSNWKLAFKYSGKIRSQMQHTAEAMNVQFYTLPKITGTRFIGHRVNAFSRFIEMWPVFTTTYENCLAGKMTPQVRAKVTGLLNKFRNYSKLCLICTYLDVLQAVGPASKVFGGEGLMAHEVKPAIDLTVMELEELVENCGTDNDLTTNLRRFMFSEDDKTGEKTLLPDFRSPGDNLKNVLNRKDVMVDMSNMTFLNSDSQHTAFSLKKSIAGKLINLLKDRFKDFNHVVYESMKWIDPVNWLPENEYDIQEIKNLSQHFESPLEEAQFGPYKVIVEWKSFRKYVSCHFRGVEARVVWQKVIEYRKSEFPNLCLLAQLVICIS